LHLKNTFAHRLFGFSAPHIQDPGFSAIMESRKSPHVTFVFPQRDMTPHDTPQSLTPTESQIDLPALAPKSAAPGMVAEPQSNETVSSVDDMPLIPRFFHLLNESKALVYTHGPYTNFAGTTVFSRAPTERDTNIQVSKKDLAISLAAAQDCAGSAQLGGPAKDDLAVFEDLWNTTIEVLEMILVSCQLHHEMFGWGIIGLCAGYIGHSHWREDSEFVALKGRLHDALKAMSSIDSLYRKNKESVANAGGALEYLARNNRAIHVCANLLLQQFRREEWSRIRWYHAVAVAERWIENLGLGNELARREHELMG
jgi:hypothetical protein